MSGKLTLAKLSHAIRLFLSISPHNTISDRRSKGQFLVLESCYDNNVRCNISWRK